MDKTGKCPWWQAAPHNHSEVEWGAVARAVVFHALRPPQNTPCEACFTADQMQACPMCVHQYATVQPSSVAEVGTIAEGDELEVLASGAFIRELGDALAMLPIMARGEVELLVSALTPELQA